jgi:predicted nuclease of predicted toxin-antitoxin system
MARLYADEQFPFEVVENLIGLGHDVLTVQAAGNANLRIPDEQVLDFATINDRAVLTLNRKDFKRLHRYQTNHEGIIICTDDANRSALAERINAAILVEPFLSGKLISVVRPVR